MSEAALVPPNATPLETAIDAVAAARRPLPDDLPRQFWNADTCPEHLLGWLALQLSVDVWDDDWSAPQKRHVIARSLSLHQIKGTESCIREYLQLADCPALKIVTPPQGFYVSEGLRPEQHRDWLASLPEVRLYRLRPRTDGNNFLSVADGELAGDGMILGSGAGDEAPGFMAGDLLDLYDATRRQAVLIENGVTTELGIDGRNSQDVERFYLPQSPVAAFFCGGYVDGMFLAPAVAEPDYIATLRRTGAPDWWNFARHGRQPISAAPETVFETVTDLDSLCMGRCLDDIYLSDGDNDKLIFERWRLLAAGVLPALQSSASFLDYDRLGMAPFTAEITLDLRQVSPPATFFMGALEGALFLTEPDPQAFRPAQRAVAAAKAARDLIWLDADAVPASTLRTAHTLNDLQLR